MAIGAGGPEVDNAPVADNERLLKAPEVAQWLRTSVAQLANMRSLGTGPPYLKMGSSVRYREGDLLAWIEAQTVRGKGEPASDGQGGS